MTSPPEKPICCPVCHGIDIGLPKTRRDRHECNNCLCEWYESERRAQPAIDETALIRAEKAIMNIYMKTSSEYDRGVWAAASEVSKLMGYANPMARAKVGKP